MLASETSRTRGRPVRDHFFDTADFALAREGLALRVRQIARKRSLALLHGAFVRETILHGPTPDLALLGPDWHATLAGLTQGAPLHLQASATITQTLREFNGALLAFETGSLTPDHQKQVFFEIELTEPAALLPEAALLLAGRFKLRQQPESLALRAIRLAGGPPPCVCKAVAGLKGDPSLDEAIVRIIQSCLTQFRANWPVFYEGDKVGAIHQMRVSMRRLRAALGLFNRVLPTADFLTLRDEAKRIATAMGEARNWDVFTIALQTGPMLAFPHEAGFATLKAQCQAHRQAGYQQVAALLTHPDTTLFLLKAEAFLAHYGWRANLPSEMLPRLAEPARIMATQALERLHRKLRKHGRKLTQLPVDERHLVRIELKKLRYMADFFAGLCKPAGRVQKFNRAAARLQEELGQLNDMAMAEILVKRLEGGSQETERALGIVLGWAAHAALGAPRSLAISWKKFLDTRLFT